MKEEEYCTILEIASVLGISRQAAIKKLKDESCEDYIEEPCKGGKRRLYSLQGLPRYIRDLIFAHRIQQSAVQTLVASDDKALVPAQPMALSTRSEKSKPIGFSLREIEETAARARLAGLFFEYLEKNRKWGSRVKAREDFAAAYNLGERGSYPEIYKIIGHAAYQTIEAWGGIIENKKKKPDETMLHALCDKRGKHRKGQTLIVSESPIAKILEDCALSPNAKLISEVIRNAKAKMEVNGIACINPYTKKPLSDDSLRRYIERFKVENYDRWVAFRKGEKQLNEECVFHIQRDYDRINVGDVVFCDGHNWNFEYLDPWTGTKRRGCLVTWYDMKSSYPVGFEISATENTQAITTALYRAILRLGKIPKVAYLDNGRAFRGTFFNGSSDFKTSGMAGLFALLGMDKIFAWSYHGESKTVERWHRDLAELERDASSFVGTSIESKPARLKRGEKLHRKIYELLMQGKVPTLETTFRALAYWIDDHSRRPQSGHLKGKCPLEVFEDGKGPGLTPEEEAKLRLLMMATEPRSIPRDGFKMPWCDERYYHPDLYGKRKQSAIIRYDWFDRSKIYVYDTENRFICEATPFARVHPAARSLGEKEDVEELARQIEMKKHQQNQTMSPMRQFCEERIIPEVQRRLEATGFEGGQVPATKKSVTVLTPSRKALPDVPMSEEEKERINREFEALQAESAREDEVVDIECEFVDLPDIPLAPSPRPSVWDELHALCDMDRYEKLMEMNARRLDVPGGELAWMALYERTEEYRRLKDHFEELQVKMAMLYQS